MNNERRCLWCGRRQDKHPEMTFASEDRFCKCSFCLQSRPGKRQYRNVNGSVAGQSVYARPKRVMKTKRNHDRSDPQ